MYVFTANCMYVYIGNAGIRVCCTYTYYAFPKSAPNKHAAYSVREGVLSNGCVYVSMNLMHPTTSQDGTIQLRMYMRQEQYAYRCSP